MKKFITPSLLFIFLFSISNVYSQYSDEYYYQKKQDYKEFLKNHEFKKRDHLTEKELKTIPKKDRPDLANEQNFLQTLDPNLGYVPLNALINAHKVTDIYTQQNKTAIPGIIWTERGPDNFGGRTRAIIWDPNDVNGKKVIAGGVAGGLWINTDITNNSTQWTAVNNFWDNLAVTALAYDPSNTQVMYAGTGEGYYNIDAIAGGGIWKSTNGGSTWSNLSSTSGYNYITRIAVASNGDVYASTNGSGVIRSTNGGTSWSKVLGSGQGASTNRAADIKIGADGTFYAAMGIFSTDGIYSSTNGTSWTKLNTGSNGFPSSNIRRIEIGCAPSNANVIYCLVQGSGNGMSGIYKTTNKGSTWTSLTMPTDDDSGVSPDFTRGAQAWYDLSVAVDPNDEDNLFIGGIDLFRSTNGGSSWSQVSHWYGGFGHQEVHADQHAAVYLPGSSSKIVFGHDGGVSYSSNATAGTPTISARNNGYNVTQFYATAINGSAGSNNMLAGAQDNGTHKYTSAGVNSTNEVTGGDGAFCHIDQSNGNNQISQYVRNVVYRTTNNWSSGTSQIFNSQSTGLFINPSDYDDKEDIYYSGHANGSAVRLLRINDPFGSANSGTVVIASGSSDVSHISASPYAAGGNSTLFVGTDAGDVYKVSNAQSGSPTVTNIGGSLPAGNISCIAIGASEQQLIVTLSNYGVVSVWETTNGGSNWTNKEGNLPNMPVRWALYNPLNYNEVFLATEVGVWTTDNLAAGSVDWSPTNTGLANVRTDMLQYRSSDNTIVAATHGRGLFTTVIPSASAPVADFSGTPTTLCEGNSVTYTDLSTNTPTGWSWSFPGGTPSTSTVQNPTITYNTAGTYNVTLTASNGSGSNPITKNNYITVNGTPGNAGTITGSANECENATGITYSISAVTGATSYNWTVPTGATVTTGQGTTSITVNFGTNSGNVSVTPSNSCGNGGSNNKAITVNICSGAPVADFIASFRYICEGSSVNFTDLSTNTPTGWSWSFPGGTPSTSTLQNPTVTYNTPGTYPVSLTATNGSGSNLETKTNYISVTAIPATVLDSTEIIAQYCGVTLSSANSLIYANVVPGASYYQFRVSNSLLSFNYETKWWNSSRWLKLMDIPGIQTNTTYNVEVRARNSKCDLNPYGSICQITTPGNSVDNTYIISSQCNTTLNQINTPIYARPITGASSYTFEISNTALSFNQTITPGGRYINLAWWGTLIQPNTTYDVKVKATVNSSTGNYSNMCQITSSSTIRLGEPYTNEEIRFMVENENQLDLIVYPNPNQGDFVYIDLSGVKSGTELFITDISGKVVQHQQLDVETDSYSGTLRFNEKLNSGFYFITVISGDQKITKKLVVR